MDELIKRLLEGEVHLLPRVISLLEKDPSQVVSFLSSIDLDIRKRTYIIGITGPPGAGKSTLISELVKCFDDAKTKIGVILCDPTSPQSGGAILGDRIRLQESFLNPNIFVRSIPNYRADGGVSPLVGVVTSLLAACDYDVVLVESVGVGQNEFDLACISDILIVALVPESGDSVQIMKSGLMELGDIYVINKSDRVGSIEMQKLVKSQVSMNFHDSSWKPPVILTQAQTSDGIEDLYKSIVTYREKNMNSEEISLNKERNRIAEFKMILRNMITTYLLDENLGTSEISSVVETVRNHKKAPYVAAYEVFHDLFFKKNKLRN